MDFYLFNGESFLYKYNISRRYRCCTAIDVRFLVTATTSTDIAESTRWEENDEKISRDVDPTYISFLFLTDSRVR